MKETALLLLLMMTLLWGYSVYKKDASIVDPWWSIGFVVAGRNAPPFLLALVALWAIRLWLHLLLRSRDKPEDPRYQAFRKRFGAERYWWVSFFQVFMLQGVLLFVISLPLQLATAHTSIVGAVLFVVGFSCEAIADFQLQRFRRSPTRTVLDTGLWRFSRHPNYFGEALLWWGLWLCAGAPLWTVLSPALLTLLLLRVSGVTLLEQRLKKTKPEYVDYIARTSAFIPWPPKRRAPV